MSIADSIRDLAKLVQQSDNLELLKKVNTVQSEVLDLIEKLKQKEDQVTQLQGALGLKGEFILKDLAYWLPDEKGNVIGGPFCARCFEADHVARTLAAGERESQVTCPDCGSSLCSPSIYDYLRPDAAELRKKEAQIVEQQMNNARRQLTDFFRSR